MDDINNQNNTPNVNPYGEQPNPYSQPQNSYSQPQNTYSDYNNYQPQQPSYYQGQNNYYDPYQQNNGNSEKKGFAIASMVIGITIFVLGCCWFYVAVMFSSVICVFPILISILALVFGIMSLSRKCGGKGMAIAGVILCSLNILANIAGFAFIAFYENVMDNYGYPFHEFFDDYVNDRISEDEFDRIIDEALEEYLD